MEETAVIMVSEWASKEAQHLCINCDLLILVDLSGLRLTGQSVAPISKDKHDHNNPRRPDEAGAHTLDKK